MEIEQIARILIIIHAGFGGIALIAGAISLIVKKGNRIHKKSGRIFYYSMLTSALMSLIISFMPNHKSPFLFCIGLFSAYFIIGGYRSLEFKRKDVSLKYDKVISYSILLVGIVMIAYPIIFEGKANIVLLVFGLFSLLFGAVDLIIYRNKNRTKKYWLQLHLSKMISGYVSAVTAFVVVNQFIPGIWAWFTPAIFGNLYLTFWLIKLSKNKTVANTVYKK